MRRLSPFRRRRTCSRTARSSRVQLGSCAGGGIGGFARGKVAPAGPARRDGLRFGLDPFAPGTERNDPAAFEFLAEKRGNRRPAFRRTGYPRGALESGQWRMPAAYGRFDGYFPAAVCTGPDLDCLYRPLGRDGPLCGRLPFAGRAAYGRDARRSVAAEPAQPQCPDTRLCTVF